MARVTWEICPDCDYPKPTGGECPNPACWPGLANYLAAMRVWEADRESHVRRSIANLGGLSGLNARRAFEEYFERDNPKPRREDYERA